MWPVVAGCLVPTTVLAWTDFRSHRVPNIITIPMLLAGLAYGVYSGEPMTALVGALSLFGIGLVCFLIGGMGGGDVKLMAALGAWFGLHTGLMILLLACVIGIVWGIGKKIKAGALKSWATDFLRSLYLRFLLNAKGALKMPQLPSDTEAPLPREAIPFGTCLALAAWLVHLGGGWLV